eukprot:CAMPEP_0203932656 /NCGR_PEP_ID=MMETSP0359-20131031/71011_1 /ASSEMBLY_ACC=CAM_ASM_000338 /TAXON_ID=268821 /ORGANISM="Scrippsiella Hangoei, Strain SHTV-5" /LENGTH=367 /DNA_ID=CAMNT_0050862127 /DNA_START=132 /DNA_END=1231 /DNA_ORIENTATION=-
MAMPMHDLGGHVVVLDADEPRVPSEDEVKEYAAFLGIDVESEPNLMWIAWEGVAAPVPTPWKACHNLDAENEDEVFYFNFETAESVWDHPCDEKYRAMVEKARAEGHEQPPSASQPPVSEGSGIAPVSEPVAAGSPEVIPNNTVEAITLEEQEESISSGSSGCSPKAKKPDVDIAALAAAATKPGAAAASVAAGDSGKRLPEVSPVLPGKVADSFSAGSPRSGQRQAADSEDELDESESSAHSSPAKGSLDNSSPTRDVGFAGRQLGSGPLDKDLDDSSSDSGSPTPDTGGGRSASASLSASGGGDAQTAAAEEEEPRKRLQPIADDISEESLSENDDLPMPEDFVSNSDARRLVSDEAADRSGSGS